jgi:hypothetical protein
VDLFSDNDEEMMKGKSKKISKVSLKSEIKV